MLTLALLLLTTVMPIDQVASGQVAIDGGELRLAYPAPGEPPTVAVAPFLLDVRQVDNAAMLAFVVAHPEWRRDRVVAAHADARYLAHWQGPDALGPVPADAPVTHVSWFAARAYCAAQGKRLPRENEWELAAKADATRRDASQDPVRAAAILGWYAQPAGLARAGVEPPNVWGVRDLHGVVWEWVEDFATNLVSGDNRERGSTDRDLFCGAGATAASAPDDYATFMRFAMRSSLEARYTTSSLGFRCARDVASPSGRAQVPAGGLLGLALDDRHGRPVLSRADERLVVAMFYATCPYACPTLLADLARLDANLAPVVRARTRYVLVTFDREHDTPEVLTRLARAHGLDDVRWVFARAHDEAGTRELAALLGVTYRRLPDGNYHHSTAIVVFDAAGHERARVTALKADPRALIEALEAP